MKAKPYQKTPLSRLERETIIVFNEAERLATVTTNSPGIAKKMTRLFGNPLSHKEGSETWEWEVPKAQVPLPRRKRALNQEKIRAMNAARVARATEKAPQ